MRLRHMLAKEYLQFIRNPVLLRMAIFLPLMQTLVLSYAANLDVTKVPVTVWDEDRSAESRDLVTKIDSTPYFTVVARRLDGRTWEGDLAAGTAQIALHFPPHYARDLARRRARLQVILDGSEANTVVVAGAYLGAMAESRSRALVVDLMNRRGMRLELPTVSVRSRVFYNPDLRTLWFIGPGVMALALAVLMQNLTALSIARERELGTLEQLVMTPIRPWELLLGKLIPFLTVGIVDACVVGCLVHFWFKVPLRGSVPVLAVAALLFIIATLGLGLLVSTVSANQQQAQLSNFFLSFPSILLSGFIFPVGNLPPVLQKVSALVPMTYFVEVIRGVFLRGAGLRTMGPHLAALAVLAALFFSAGALSFHKRMD